MALGNPKRITSLGIGVWKNDDVPTPDYMLKDLREEFGEDLYDPCPLGGKGGLGREEWGKVSFVNPPYSQVKLWVEKALDEVGRGAGRTVVMLMPARTNSAYWHRRVFPFADEIRFLDKNIQFTGFKNTCPFPLALVVFRSCRVKSKPVLKRHPESLIRKKTPANYQYHSWLRRHSPSADSTPSSSSQTTTESTDSDSPTRSTGSP